MDVILIFLDCSVTFDVLSAFRNFDSYGAKTSISELISRSRSSRNFGRIPSAYFEKQLVEVEKELN